MKFDNVNKELQSQVKEVMQKENKEEAVIEAMNLIVTANNQDLIAQIQSEAQRAESDSEYRAKLGLRTLNKEEKAFYERVKDPKQAITGDQIDIFPTTIIDNTLEDIKKESKLLSLVNFAPANVTKWLVAEKSGTYGWGGLTDALTKELEATFKTLNIELSKLHVMMIIPKAIADLSLPFVDRYFQAILKEAANDGLEYGFLEGTGKNEPIGIFKLIESMNGDGTHKAKTTKSDITNFSPKGLAATLVALSKDGKRVIDKLYLVCNPVDRYNYVNPALYGEVLTGGYVTKSFIDIEVIESTNCTKGKAAFTIDKKYTMGFSGLQINEYKETKAIEDANLLIAKAYANGIAVDDSTAVIFDVTKLEEYVLKVKDIAATVTP